MEKFEISKEREYVIASNKHRNDDYLQFWGYLTPDNAERRSFGGYPADIQKCEKYTLKELENEKYFNSQSGFPLYDSSMSIQKLRQTEHYIIKVSELEKVFRKVTYVNVHLVPSEVE